MSREGFLTFAEAGVKKVKEKLPEAALLEVIVATDHFLPTKDPRNLTVLHEEFNADVSNIDSGGVKINSIEWGKWGPIQRVSYREGMSAFQIKEVKFDLDKAYELVGKAGIEFEFNKVELYKPMYQGSYQPLYIFQNTLQGFCVSVGAVDGKVEQIYTIQSASGPERSMATRDLSLTLSLLGFAFTGNTVVQNVHPHAALMAISAATNNNVPTINPRDVSSLTLDYNEAVKLLPFKGLKLQSVKWGHWGPIQNTHGSGFGIESFKLTPRMLDLPKICEIIKQSGLNFKFNKLDISKPLVPGVWQPYYYLQNTVTSEGLQIGAYDGTIENPHILQTSMEPDSVLASKDEVLSYLGFALTGVNKVHEKYKQSRLLAISGSTKDQMPSKDPRALQSLSLNLAENKGTIPAVGIHSTSWGEWGSVEKNWDPLLGLSDFKITSNLLDLPKVVKLIQKAGFHDFEFNNVTIYRPLTPGVWQPYYHLKNNTNDQQLRVGAIDGHVEAIRGDISLSRYATLSFLGFAESGIPEVSPENLLLSVTGTSKDEKPIKDPKLIDGMTMIFGHDPTSYDKGGFKLQSLSWGQWGPKERVDVPPIGNFNFEITEQLIDFAKAHELMVKAGCDFEYNKVELFRPQRSGDFDQPFYYVHPMMGAEGVSIGAINGKVQRRSYKEMMGTA